jgi:tRNA modification GTPase
MHSRTIAAIATPAGHAGIGIVKISGGLSIPIAREIFRKSSKDLDTPFLYNDGKKPTRGFFHGYIVDPETKGLIDEGLVLVMPGPRSYTREDVVEIHCHGGPGVVHTVLELVLKKGAVPAEPGEFTKIAFLNGRIDLTQAEAVMDLIRAESADEIEMAAKQLHGDLKNKVQDILAVIREIAVQGEAAIDFPEEVGDLFQKEEVSFLLHEKVIFPVEELVHRYLRAGERKKGFKVVIIGRPNVGKSSLMNSLLEKDRVIVADIPGTTRDFIEENMSVKGMHFILSDTAGLHEALDEIEKIGLQKTRDQLVDADLVLFVLDLSFGVREDERRIFDQIKHKNCLLVFNKADLAENQVSVMGPAIPKDWAEHRPMVVSAKFQTNMDGLKKEIFNALSRLRPKSEGAVTVTPNLRHFHCLQQCLESANSALTAINDGLPVEFCVIDLKRGIQSLEEILGISSSTDILDLIFSEFCIGK